MQADRVALVVGVTGHRDVAPADEAPLRAAFAGILDDLSRSCPHTPLLVLSGLAAGADSLAAEEALARNVAIVACLPMPVEEYERDFAPAELERFHVLLAQAARVIVTSPQRESGYVAAGRFITQYSHVVVAFWDGEAGRGAGGTADVVSMRLTGEAHGDIESVRYLPDVGPVDQIVTPRAEGGRSADAFVVRRRYPRLFLRESDAGDAFRRAVAAIDLYNADLAHVAVVARGSELHALVERTDVAANRLQRSANRFQTALLSCAFVVAGVQFVTHFPAIWKVAGLLVAFLVYEWAKTHDYENRYQDYRAVAEGLRVQNAWHCAGLTGRLVDNEYLKMQEGELQWIRMALRYFYLACCEGRPCAQAGAEHPDCATWVRSQWRYYYKAGRREARSKTLLDRIGRVAIVVAMACTAASFAALVVDGQWYCALFGARCPSPAVLAITHFDLYVNFLTVPIAMVAVLVALFGVYAEKQNLGANARRYARMFRVFDRARRSLLDIRRGKPGAPSQILYELGRAALVEHADWLIARRERPMKVIVV